ncbi:MAG: hypothetical protein WBC36_06080 [Desulfobacterales bacterium]
MIESGASANHGGGKIVSKDGSGSQSEGIFVVRGLSREDGNQWSETALDRDPVFYPS